MFFGEIVMNVDVIVVDVNNNNYNSILSTVLVLMIICSVILSHGHSSFRQ